MKNIRKWLCLLLAVLMVVGMMSMASCADEQQQPDGEEQNPTGTDTPDEPTEPEVERLPLDLPDANYNGKEIHFMSWSANGQTEIGTGWIPWEEVDVPDYDGDPINKAVYDRNGTVEEKFNVEITTEYVDVDGDLLVSRVRSNHQSGDDAFQIMTSRSYEIKSIVLEQLMYNMYDLSNLHTDMPWWNQDSVQSFTLGSTLFFAAPEMLLRDKGATACMYYNATVATNNNITNLYETVMDGDWTFDEYLSLSESVATSLDGDDLMNSPTDLWGSSIMDDTVYYLFAGANMKFAHIDEDGYIAYDYGSDESILYMQDIYDLVVYSDHCAHGDVKKFTDAPKEGIFSTDNALFLFSLVKSIQGLRNMESDFGVLPIPKYDEYQENYASLVWVHHDCVLGIPAVVSDAEAVSAVLEYMNYLSYYDIYPIFYDTVIMGKSTRDEQSKEMLKIVFETRLFDPGQYWDNGSGMSGIHGDQGYLRLAKTGQSNVASIFGRFEQKIEYEFGRLNDLIDELG